MKNLQSLLSESIFDIDDDVKNMHIQKIKPVKQIKEYLQYQLAWSDVFHFMIKRYEMKKDDSILSDINMALIAYKEMRWHYDIGDASTGKILDGDECRLGYTQDSKTYTFFDCEKYITVIDEQFPDEYDEMIGEYIDLIKDTLEGKNSHHHYHLDTLVHQLFGNGEEDIRSFMSQTFADVRRSPKYREYLDLIKKELSKFIDRIHIYV